MRFAFFLSFLALASLFLAGLGVWQIQRGDWKHDLITSIETRLALPPIRPDSVSDSLIWRRVEIAGVLAPRHLLLYSLHGKYGPGWRVIVPFAPEEGVWLLADLGFFPHGAATPDLPSGRQTLTGLIMPSRAPALFEPEPNIAARQWYSADAASMSDALALAPPAQLFLRLEGKGNERPLLREPFQLSLPDNHFSYALTWFALAAIAFAMLVFFSLKGRL